MNKLFLFLIIGLFSISSSCQEDDEVYKPEFKEYIQPLNTELKAVDNTVLDSTSLLISNFHYFSSIQSNPHIILTSQSLDDLLNYSLTNEGAIYVLANEVCKNNYEDYKSIELAFGVIYYYQQSPVGSRYEKYFIIDEESGKTFFNGDVTLLLEKLLE